MRCELLEGWREIDIGVQEPSDIRQKFILIAMVNGNGRQENAAICDQIVRCRVGCEDFARTDLHFLLDVPQTIEARHGKRSLARFGIVNEFDERIASNARHGRCAQGFGCLWRSHA